MNSAMSASRLLGGWGGLALALLVVFPAAAEEFTGIVHPQRDLTLSLGVGGVVAQVEVEVGQKVRAGQLLLALDDRLPAVESARRRVIWEDQSEVRTVEARLVILRTLYENARALQEKTGGVSLDEVRKLELEVISSAGRLEQLRAQKKREELEYQGAEQERQAMRLTAPSDGVVTRVDLDVGEWSRPGDALMRLVNSASSYLNVSVSRQAARGLAPGVRLPVRVEGLASPLSGRITFVSPVADAASGLVELRVAFDNPQGQVRPGATGRVQLSPR